MCQCDPKIRLPYCGNGDCVWPISGQKFPSILDMLSDFQPPANADGSQIWFAVSDMKVVRGQPLALFRLASDACLIGRTILFNEHDMAIDPILVTLPSDIDQPNAPMPPITIFTSED